MGQEIFYWKLEELSVILKKPAGIDMRQKLIEPVFFKCADAPLVHAHAQGDILNRQGFLLPYLLEIASERLFHTQYINLDLSPTYNIICRHNNVSKLYVL